MPEGYLLGIDCGTNSLKSILFEEDGRVAGSSSQEYGVIYPKVNWAEQDPDAWWEALRVTASAVLRSGRLLGRSIIGVGLTSQREAVIPIDEGGTKLMNAIIWLDRRTMRVADQMRQVLSDEHVINTTGLPIDYFFSAAKILWIKNERPEVMERAKAFLFPKDYLSFGLTGRISTDYSMASRTMLFDIKRKRWDDEITEALGIDRDSLPPAGPAWRVIGFVTAEAAEATGIPEGTPVVSGGGDRPCEALGGGAYKPGTVSIGTGTGTTMEVPTDHPIVDLTGRAFCCCHVVPDMFEYELSILTTGASLRWFRDTFATAEVQESQRVGEDAYRLLDALSEPVPLGADGLLFYPYLAGSKFPKFNEKARGVFFGITLGHSRGHFIRSILEGVAFQYMETLEITKELGVRVDSMVMSGGETKSPLWNQLKADAIGLPIAIAEASQYAAALGAAILAGTGAGLYRSVRAGVEACVRVSKLYQPNEERHVGYLDAFERYKKVYDRLKPAFDELPETGDT